ncbi:MAG: hypothetical protein WCG02_00135 [Candidatus Taylorbacteria bacterium]
MHQSLFFKLFPPPIFMARRFAGLEISDDALRCLQYESTIHGPIIRRYDEVDMPEDTIVGGDIKNEVVLLDLLAKFVAKNKLSHVNVSVPEEKAYLFQTDVTGKTMRDVAQNIEFKLEENVPLAARDAVFYFDIMPTETTGGVLRASVSVVPRTYIEMQISILQKVGVLPIAFEVVPKSIARAALQNTLGKTSMIIHIMKHKTGIYIVSNGVVCFTSTVANKISVMGQPVAGPTDSFIELLSREISHTLTYWATKSAARVDEVILAGIDAEQYRSKLAVKSSVGGRPVSIADAWRNMIDIDHYIPTIPKSASQNYIVAAGLAIDS